MKSIIATVLIGFSGFFGFASTSYAQDKPDTPSALSGGKVISVDDAKKLIDDGKLNFSTLVQL